MKKELTKIDIKQMKSIKAGSLEPGLMVKW
jgi:hypothetical protein